MTDTITIPRALRNALEQPQQDALADALRLLRTAIQTGHPEYGPADWIDMIDTALEGLPQEPDLYAVFRYAREADTPLLRHCLELIEGEWPADDPAAGSLMVKLRQRLGVGA